jgi:hypothetical protein
MRCVRPEVRDSPTGVTEPCERCKRNDRTCTIPSPRPLGRKPGAVGRYRGLEKALHLMRSELRKAQELSGDTQSIEEFSIISNSEGDFLDDLPPFQNATQTDDFGSRHIQGKDMTDAVLPAPISMYSSVGPVKKAAPQQSHDQAPLQKDHETISNPLGLLVDASGAAQPLDRPYLSATTQLSGPDSSNCHTSPASATVSNGLARYLLCRPGYVSLGLKLSSESLENGLDTLLTAERPQYRYSHYFKPPDSNLTRDTGPDVDPIDLGLISMDTAYYLFPM